MARITGTMVDSFLIPVLQKFIFIGLVSTGFQNSWNRLETRTELDKMESDGIQAALGSTSKEEPFELLNTAQSLQLGPTAIASISGGNCDENSESSFALSGSIEMLSIANFSSEESVSDEPNVVLAPEEIATLNSLMERYDQVLLDIDALNARLQELVEKV